MRCWKYFPNRTLMEHSVLYQNEFIFCCGELGLGHVCLGGFWCQVNTKDQHQFLLIHLIRDSKIMARTPLLTHSRHH